MALRLQLRASVTHLLEASAHSALSKGGIGIQPPSHRYKVTIAGMHDVRVASIFQRSVQGINVGTVDWPMSTKLKTWYVHNIESDTCRVTHTPDCQHIRTIVRC